MMIDIATYLNDVDFDDAKNCANAKKMWDKMKPIYGGDGNVKRANDKILRGRDDQMRAKESENVAQYVNQIKDVVSVIKVGGDSIFDSKIVSKVLRTLLHVYDIKVFDIQEVRAMHGNDLMLDGLVGWLSVFEMRNYDNSMATMGNKFKYSLTIKN